MNVDTSVSSNWDLNRHYEKKTLRSLVCPGFEWLRFGRDLNTTGDLNNRHFNTLPIIQIQILLDWSSIQVMNQKVNIMHARLFCPVFRFWKINWSSISNLGAMTWISYHLKSSHVTIQNSLRIQIFTPVFFQSGRQVEIISS